MQNSRNSSNLTQPSLSGLPDDIYSESVCCGIPLTGISSFVEHVEEFHSLPQGNNDQFAELSHLDSVGFFPMDMGPTFFDESHDSFIPEISVSECCSQMLANFTKFKSGLVRDLDHSALGFGSSEALNTPQIFHEETEQPLSTFDHCTNLKSIGLAPTRRVFENSELNGSRVRGTCKNSQAKVFPCPNKGCSKRYKNPNGLKYHLVQGRCSVHMVDYAQDKPYRCKYPNCFYAYKNSNGLKYHEEHVHKKEAVQSLDAEAATIDDPLIEEIAQVPEKPAARFSVVSPPKRCISPSNLISSFRCLHPAFLALLTENPPPPHVVANVIKKPKCVKLDSQQSQDKLS